MATPTTTATNAANTTAEPTLVAPQVERLDAPELADLLSADRDAVVVVDVRDAGTEGGFIRGALSVPKTQFDSDDFVDKFVQEHAGDQLLVFHCLNSNTRGPTAAGRVYDRIAEALKSADKKPNVKVLKGGFKVFSERYGDDEKLVDPSALPQ
ncbi:hypothetical protein PybrP1_001748 [[Pythium] brassicae (nom. inval.)]|nr:hypothetical protein PybrP1_001748 [[Pythium] brassicae (nom. inval.)]